MQLSSRRQLALAQASQAKRCSRNVEHNCPILTDTQFSYSRKTLMIDFGTSTPFFFDVRWNGMDQNRGFCWKKNPKEKQTPWGTELRCCGCYVRLVMDTWIHTWVLEVKSISRKISWKWFHVTMPCHGKISFLMQVEQDAPCFLPNFGHVLQIFISKQSTKYFDQSLCENILKYGGKIFFGSWKMIAKNWSTCFLLAHFFGQVPILILGTKLIRH